METCTAGRIVLHAKYYSELPFSPQVEEVALLRRDQTEPMRGFVHHVVLTVRNPEQCFRLYDSVLTALGYRLEQKDERGFGWYLETPSGSHSIHVARASEDGAKRRHDRYSPGLHHLAWKVDSPAEVDRMHERLLSVGATILDPPAEYPQYNKGRGYYAVFFADPDGLKLEVVYTPPSDKAL